MSPLAWRILLWTLFFSTTCAGQILFKFASLKDSTASSLGLSFSALGLSGWALWGISGLIWIEILRADTLTAANALSSLRFFAVGLAAWLCLNEIPAPSQLIGLVVISVGVWLTLS